MIEWWQKPTGRTALYRLRDAGGVLLYVGISNNPDVRVTQHYSEAWYPRMASRTVEWFETREEAESAEIEAIRAEEPRFNVKDNPRQSADIQALLAERKLRSERLPHTDDFPAYFRVAAHVRAQILSGELPPGARIPARHVYATKFGVSVETVKRACDELEDAGWLSRQYVAPFDITE